MLYQPVSNKDLSHVLLHTGDSWDQLRGKTLFITGGTGFFGKWLLQTFAYANKQYGLGARAIVLTRDPGQFLADFPQMSDPAFRFIRGDIRHFEVPEEDIHYIIHAATEASAALNERAPLDMYDTIVEGTRRVLELARAKRVTAVLHTSSGAVYGKQPSGLTHVPETFGGSPMVFSADAAYGEAKRVAEMMAGIYHRSYGVPSKIARCFAFVGPYLPLDTHFAIGNFMQNILSGTDIHIKGDGTPYRSYMYPSDLMIWLYRILLEAPVMEPFNVGSDQDFNLAGIAAQVAACGGNTSVHIAQQPTGQPPARYVPSIEKARRLLGLELTVTLDEAIEKTLSFYRNH